MEAIKLAFEVITSPFSGFKKLKEKKTFLLPFLLTVLVYTGTFSYYAFNVDFKYVITRQLEMSGKLEELPKQQVDKLIDMQAKMGKYFVAGTAFFSPFFYILVISFYLFVMAKIYASDLSFKDAIVITGNGFFVFLFFSIVFMAIMLLTDFKTATPETLMPTSLAYYFSYETVGKKLYALFSKIDLFGIWFTSLLGIGFHIFTEESLVKSMLTVFIPYILIAVISVLLA